MEVLEKSTEGCKIPNKIADQTTELEGIIKKIKTVAENPEEISVLRLALSKGRIPESAGGRNWFDFNPETKRSTCDKMVGYFLFKHGFSEQEIESLCKKALWIIENSADASVESALQDVFKTEYPKFYKKYKQLFFKILDYNQNLTQQELKEAELEDFSLAINKPLI